MHPDSEVATRYFAFQPRAQGPRSYFSGRDPAKGENELTEWLTAVLIVALLLLPLETRNGAAAGHRHLVRASTSCISGSLKA
jgi:hypothetical protein